MQKGSRDLQEYLNKEDEPGVVHDGPGPHQQVCGLHARHQFIHVDPEKSAQLSPFKVTIAHGFLTLSMLTHLQGTVKTAYLEAIGHHDGRELRLRESALRLAVKVNSKIRMRRELIAVELKNANTIHLTRMHRGHRGRRQAGCFPSGSRGWSTAESRATLRGAAESARPGLARRALFVFQRDTKPAIRACTPREQHWPRFGFLRASSHVLAPERQIRPDLGYQIGPFASPQTPPYVLPYIYQAFRIDGEGWRKSPGLLARTANALTRCMYETGTRCGWTFL